MTPTIVGSGTWGLEQCLFILAYLKSYEYCLRTISTVACMPGMAAVLNIHEFTILCGTLFTVQGVGVRVPDFSYLVGPWFY